MPNYTRIMKVAKVFGFFLLSTLLVLTGCKDDFQLNADYNRQPVVYGILDPSSDQQIMMINHTFLGDGSAFDYALIEDSSLYNNLEARVFWNDGANSVALTETIIDDKDVDGLFFAPNQTVYTAPSSSFNFMDNVDDVYRIGAIGDGDTIYAETQLVNMTPTDVQLPIGNLTGTGFVSTASQPNDPTYRNVKVKFKTVKYAIKHAVAIKVSYEENYLDGSAPVDKVVKFNIKTLEAADDIGGDSQEFDYWGELFFQALQNRVEVDANVDFRSLGTVEFEFTAFGTDISSYIDIINPASGVGQETPAFSNINDGEGRGVFYETDWSCN